MRFGIHLPLSGGLLKTAEHAREIGCKSLQIFSGNPRGWAKKPLDKKETDAFCEAAQEFDIGPVVVHATYLINLGAPNNDVYKKSQVAFVDELKRSAQLGAPYYVVHPGSSRDAGRDFGCKRVIESLKKALDKVPDGPDILLETTAGAGNTLGTTFEELAGLIEPLKSDRVGVCLDTCHIFVAGYDLRTKAGSKKIIDDFDKIVGLNRLRCLHVNDTNSELNSHLDRHEHIGEGQIGESGFKAFFGDKRWKNLKDIPAVLETPQKEPLDDAKDVRAAVEIAVKAGCLSKSFLKEMPDLKKLRKTLTAAKPAKKKKAAKKKKTK